MLEKSQTDRMQVVKTRYKALSGMEPRQFIEKKLYFCCNQKDEHQENIVNSDSLSKPRSMSAKVIKLASNEILMKS